MNALIFGVNSQDGYYLTNLLKSKGISCFGVSRSEGEWINGNINDREFVNSIIKSIKPELVIHIAAISNTKHNSLFENHEAISTGTLNLLEAVKNHIPDSKIFITGSGVQFVNNGKPIIETDDFEANSPYSLARIHSVYAARYYRKLGLKVYVGYLFHHESYLRKMHHVSKKISETVARIREGSTEKLYIGDPSVKKEWTFAGDVAAGIFTLISQNEVFEACIGSGVVNSIQDWVEACFTHINVDWKKHLVVEDGYKAEYMTLISNPSIIKSLGWEAKTDIYSLAYKMVNREL
jgi:GDPmannose 4,6-dehydratase